ncbi:MAG: DUF3574 domain-containing protein [Leptolyngbya sp. IPPAS B-1204]
MQLYPVLPENETAPALIQQNLYFGRNIGTTGRVTEQQFQQFVEDVVTPRFPTGVTEYDAKGAVALIEFYCCEGLLVGPQPYHVAHPQPLHATKLLSDSKSTQALISSDFIRLFQADN